MVGCAETRTFGTSCRSSIAFHIGKGMVMCYHYRVMRNSWVGYQQLRWSLWWSISCEVWLYNNYRWPSAIAASKDSLLSINICWAKIVRINNQGLEGGIVIRSIQYWSVIFVNQWFVRIPACLEHGSAVTLYPRAIGWSTRSPTVTNLLHQAGTTWISTKKPADVYNS